MKKVALIVSLLVIICIGIILFLNKKEEMKEYVITYYSDIYVYNIKTNKNNINVVKNDSIQCITTPCDPIKIAEYNVEYTKEYKEFIKDLFKDKETNNIALLDINLNEKQKQIISKIIEG